MSKTVTATFGNQKPIKVLHVIDSSGHGGGERYILDLIRFASPQFAHQVAIPSAGYLARQLEIMGPPYFVIHMAGLFSLKSVMDLRRLIKESDIDIIHSHGYRANIYSRTAALVASRPHICTMHVSLYDYMDTPSLIRWIYIFLERISALVSKRFICISKAMADDAIRMGIDPKRILQIHNGVDTHRFHPDHHQRQRQIREELGISKNGPVIGTVGRMVTEKGQFYLIKSLSRLKSEFQDLTCLFVGNGPLFDQLVTAAKAVGVYDMCVFTGVRDDMERIYPALDLFVLPSLREPFGLSILEAMACGVPVIATNAGGPMDVIRSGENGMLVKPKDATALSEQISMLLKDPKKRERISAAGLDTVCQRFSIEQTVAGIESVYRETLNLF